MSTRLEELQMTFSEDMINAVEEAGVTLAVLPTFDDNLDEYVGDVLFIGIRPERDFEESGSFTYKTVDLDFYWTHCTTVDMPDANEKADEALLNGLTQLQDRFDRDDFRKEIKDHFVTKFFHKKDIERCADKAEEIMSNAVEAAEKVLDRDKGKEME